MKTRLVYRIENAAGKGAWACGAADSYGSWAYDTLGEYPITPSEMPGPLGEPATTKLHQHYRHGEFTKEQLFAYRSLKNLRRWWPKAGGRRNAAENDGARVSVYQVPVSACLLGTEQVVFDRRQATLIRTLDLATLKPV